MKLKEYNSIPSNDALQEDLANDGVVICKGAVGGAFLEELNREFAEVFAVEGRIGVSHMSLNVGSGASLSCSELGEHLPQTREFFTAEWMQELSDWYWDGRALLNDKIYVMHEVVGTEHIAQELHFDVQKTLKFFLYLNDVTAENGAFSCVPGSHRLTREVREKLGNEISYDNRHLTREHPYGVEDIVPVEGPAGSLIVFTTEVWHRAGIVAKGERKVMRGHTRAAKVATEKESKSKEESGGPGLGSRLRGMLRRN
ncbi:MAG: phytanoyl-CoA dioxygenase family protein [Verrucomicrobiota bacterium]